MQNNTLSDISLRIRHNNASLLPDMVQLKYAFMAENAFRFFRGANHLFFEDLINASGFPSSPATWICGDLHLENFGTYKSDNRLVYFDLNDFDEALLGPALFDVVRLVTSIFVAFDTLDFDDEKASHLAKLFLKTYAEKMASGKASYIEPNTAEGILKDFLAAVSQRKQKDILRKRTVKKKDRLSILLDDPRHFELEKKVKLRLRDHIEQWIKEDGRSPYNYKVADAVFRLAGTGSVGLHRYAILLRSLNEAGDKYILLDMKESGSPVLAPCLPQKQPAWTSEADRIVTIQSWMQNRSPALLSTTIFEQRPYVIQEMQPTKDSIDFTLLRKDYRGMIQVIGDMAMLTASSQIRTASRQGAAIADELISFGKSPDWITPVLDYARGYAATVIRQYRQFKSDFENGLLTTSDRWDNFVDPRDGLALE